MKKRLVVGGVAAVLVLGTIAVSAAAPTDEVIVLNSTNGYTLDLRICLRGDVTGDGKINARDINAIRRYMADSVTYPLTESDCGDVTHDNKTNARDINAIRRYMADSVTYPITDPS